MNRRRLVQIASNLALAGVLWLLVAVWGWWPVGVIVVAGYELISARGRSLSSGDWVQLVAGLAAVLALASYPVGTVWRLIVVGVYAAWRWWLSLEDEQRWPLRALVSQALVAEVIFVWAAAGGGTRTEVTALVCASSFVIARDLVKHSTPEAATVLAATWALVAAELAWVLEAWLVTYVVRGQGLLVPQPTLVLSGVAYCFGSIYLAQRQGQLSRWRLLEYVVVGALILLIVAVGTSWRPAI